jgi:dihydroflavonol-4-reductase
VVHAATLTADAAERLLGLSPSLLVLDEVRLTRVPLFFSSDKARAELGYQPRPAAHALAAAATWCANAGLDGAPGGPQRR